MTEKDKNSRTGHSGLSPKTAGSVPSTDSLPFVISESPSGAIYGLSDIASLQSMPVPRATHMHNLSSIDELLERDKKREEDGFPKKINIGRLVKPGPGGKGKIILVPTTIEEKFIHDPRSDEEEEEGQADGGSGDGEEGEVIGEEPVHGAEGAGEGGAGQGEGGEHEIESSAYDLGRILTEKFELPNLEEKGKRRSLTRYTYDLTDRHRGVGQILDKKATLKKIVETNINLSNIPEDKIINPEDLLFSPADMVYRVLSKEKDYESQAMVFFIRDYSGSMTGKPTDLVVSQHVLIYSWLLFQYEKQVETRFVLHDTEAKEVPDFYTYYTSSVAGGTRIEAAYKMVNDLVEQENLAQDYNIYIFHGTDGDDWDRDGSKTLPHLKEMIGYSSRIGITVAETPYGQGMKTTLENYIQNSKFLEDYPKLIRLDKLGEDANESRIIDSIKNLIT